MHGCTPIAPGCRNCWAEKMAKRQTHMGNYDPADPFGVVCDESKLDEPLRLRKPAVIGTAFMGDLFHKDVPFDFIDRVFAVMALCPQHTFLVFTKRPGRVVEYFDDPIRRSYLVMKAATAFGLFPVDVEHFLGPTEIMPPWPLANVQLYTSISDQATADENIPHLLRCPAAVHGISYEPALGLVEFCGEWLREGCPGCGGDEEYCRCDLHGEYPEWTTLNHVIIGCESGPGRRPCELEWIESVVEQCQAASVPVYVKQMEIGGMVDSNVLNFPEHLRLRETPPRRANAKGE